MHELQTTTQGQKIMATRLRNLKQIPWTGGLVTAQDESLIGPDALTQADNMFYSTQGTRRQREGINANWDNLDINSVSTITNSGPSTVRTLVTGSSSSSITATAASDLINWTAHGLSAGTEVIFQTTNTLPAPLSTARSYYVVSPATNSFSVSLTSGGAAVDITDTGTGTHYCYVPTHRWAVGDTINVSGATDTDMDTSSAATITTVDSAYKSTVTISSASPGVVTWTGHGLIDDDPVVLTNSGGALPTAFTAGRTYFVNYIDADTFSLATEPDGTSINTASTGTGTHYCRKALEEIVTYAGTSASVSTAYDAGMTLTLGTRIIAQCDYWYGSTSAKTHYLMMFTSAGQLWQLNVADGTRTLIRDGGTVYTVPSGGIPRASMCVFENRLIVCAEGTSNITKHYMPLALGGAGVLSDITNTTNYADTPVASICRTHLGRLWLNDQNNPDRLHYSETGSYNVWQGAGDSGAIDIGVGDGDPEGITALMPPFKGQLFIAKRTKLYRLEGQYPETLAPIRISSDLGCVAHQACCAIDQDDLVFMSDRGIHSMSATQQFGSFSSSYLSADIQPTVNSEWSASRRKYIQIVYLQQYNTVVVGVAESSDTEQNNLYMFNIIKKAWFRWPSVKCASIAVVRDTDQQRLFLGQDTGRVAKTFVGTNTDTSSAGVDSSVTMTLTSGLIFPEQDPSVDIAYKKLSVFLKAVGTYTLTLNFKIDDFSSQALSLTSVTSSSTLGTSFTLGTSLLGQTRVSAAYTQQIDGLGRGFKVSVEQSGATSDLDLMGYQCFYEPSMYTQETRNGDSA